MSDMSRPHQAPGFDGTNGRHKYGHGTGPCAFGCGCWAGPWQSGGPPGIDPLGACPKSHPSNRYPAGPWPFQSNGTEDAKGKK